MFKVSIRDFSFRYRKDQRPIISNINLDFSSDERILILGPSGGGKSTLLLALLRLYTAYDIYFADGDVYFNGKPAEEMTRNEIIKIFGVVFQTPSHQFCLQYPEEEAAFGLENLQVEPSKMQGLIDKSFERFGFSKREQSIQTLSGGEQQVLAAASTTLLESRMLVMDEPTAHLDPTGRKEFRKALRSWLSPEKGFLLVEHHVKLWLDLVERVIVLDKKGRIIFDEQGIDVLTRERNLLTKMGVWLPEQEGRSCGSGGFVNIQNECQAEKKPALEFKNSFIGYQRKQIIKNLDLKIERGEFTALVGRNGCGKSTILQSLIGLSDLQTGSISIDGKLYRTPGKKLKLKDAPAYLFQNPEHQFVYPTVQEEVQDSVLLKRYGLYDKRHQNPFTLSGGEKRRLSLISLLTKERELYLLDEPTFGQDSKTAGELVQTIKELQENEKTVVVVSHDLALFEDLVQRIIVLNAGAVVFDGTPSELSVHSSEELNEWGVEL